jgi:hypothetical protein
METLQLRYIQKIEFSSSFSLCLSLVCTLSIDHIPRMRNSSFDLDGFAEASMEFEEVDVNRQHLPDKVLEESSSEQSFHITDKQENCNTNSDHRNAAMESTSPITGAAAQAASDPAVPGGFEYEASMHLSEVFRLSDMPETTPPVPLQAAAAVPKGPGELSSFLESGGGGGGTTRLAGVRKWIKEKLDEQDEDNENHGNRRGGKSVQDDESELSFSESASQMSGTNIGGGCGAWVRQSSQQPV